eukprot:1331770-Rhodomonas_salina.4
MKERQRSRVGTAEPAQPCPYPQKRPAALTSSLSCLSSLVTCFSKRYGSFSLSISSTSSSLKSSTSSMQWSASSPSNCVQHTHALSVERSRARRTPRSEPAQRGAQEKRTALLHQLCHTRVFGQAAVSTAAHASMQGRVTCSTLLGLTPTPRSSSLSDFSCPTLPSPSPPCSPLAAAGKRKQLRQEHRRQEQLLQSEDLCRLLRLRLQGEHERERACRRRDGKHARACTPQHPKRKGGSEGDRAGIASQLHAHAHG